MLLSRASRSAKRERSKVPLRQLIRVLTVAITAAIVADCAGTGGKPQTAVALPDATATQTALKAVLQSGPAQPARRDRVLAFYQARDFLPVWTGGADAVKRTAEVSAMLARAHEQGLRDADYRVALAPPKVGGEQAAAFEIRFTDAVLRYARDVRAGRVSPSAIYDDVGLPANDFDAGKELADAVGTQSLAAFFSGLPPTHPEYRRLAAAFAHYRQIAEGGGWPTLDGTKEVKLDGSDPRLSTLIARLAFEDQDFAAIAKPTAAQLHDAVKRFQGRNGLDEDGRARGDTLAALNVTAADRADEIAANMERWRWMPAQLESRYVAVNVPDQSVEYVRDGEPVLHSRVIVGRKSTPTPITRAAIEAVVVNPPWDIPGDIAARALLPHLIRNPNYLATRHMVIMDGPPHDPYGRTIAWKKIVPAEFPYAIRQLPGPDTALGSLMLDSPNDFDVYLHDTPNKKWFAADDREISNGCVRVQEIFKLASLALTDDPSGAMANLTKTVKSKKTQRVALDTPLPVYFLYWTAIANEDGSVEFRPDLYDRDSAMIAALKGAGGGASGAKKRANPPPDEEMDEDDVGP